MEIKDDSVSDYDREKMDSFCREKCYFVDLPWNEDKLVEVPSNHQVTLNVLDRVVIKLEKQNQYNDYCKVFLDQESEGIIERIDVSPTDCNKYIWVPHRPVIKKDPVCTSKIRPVFNCSLRTGGICLYICGIFYRKFDAVVLFYLISTKIMLI